MMPRQLVELDRYRNLACTCALQCHWSANQCHYQEFKLTVACLCMDRAHLNAVDFSRSIASANSPLYLSSALPLAQQPSTSSAFIPANCSTIPGVTTLLQLPNSTSIANQQSSDSSSTVIMSHHQNHFLPGMSSHNPPLSFTPLGGAYHVAASNGHTTAGGVGYAPPVAVMLPTAGPSSTAAEGVAAQQGAGTSKKKSKGTAAKKTDAQHGTASKDAQKGDAPFLAGPKQPCTCVNARAGCKPSESWLSVLIWVDCNHAFAALLTLSGNSYCL